jgi:hypothetical protein
MEQPTPKIEAERLSNHLLALQLTTLIQTPNLIPQRRREAALHEAASRLLQQDRPHGHTQTPAATAGQEDLPMPMTHRPRFSMTRDWRENAALAAAEPHRSYPWRSHRSYQDGDRSEHDIARRARYDRQTVTGMFGFRIQLVPRSSPSTHWRWAVITEAWTGNQRDGYSWGTIRKEWIAHPQPQVSESSAASI